jgi:4-amino-4-deoxy-L-arabinose transferase-like glycosyltransferase
MESVLVILMVVGWIWSVARGIQVSLLCCVLNFIFPPISQMIFSIYETKMRAPTILMLGTAGALIYLSGKFGVNVSTSV